jgi:hypothetical protein
VNWPAAQRHFARIPSVDSGLDLIAGEEVLVASAHAREQHRDEPPADPFSALPAPLLGIVAAGWCL